MTSQNGWRRGTTSLTGRSWRPPPSSSAGCSLRGGGRSGSTGWPGNTATDATSPCNCSGPKSLTVDDEAARGAERLFGLKGYITSAAIQVLSGAEVIAAYHWLFEVEASFRLAESDPRARPICHRTRESIQAHLTMVFCALAVSRRIQSATGMNITKVIQTLHRLREAVLEGYGETIAVPAALTANAREILDTLQLRPADIGPHDVIEARSERNASVREHVFHVERWFGGVTLESNASVSEACFT